MSFPDSFGHAIYVAVFLILQSCPYSFAQNAVLTGSIYQDSYRPRIVTEDAVLSQSAAGFIPMSTMAANRVPMAAAPMASMHKPPVVTAAVPMTLVPVSAAPRGAVPLNAVSVTSVRIPAATTDSSKSLKYVEQPRIKEVYVRDNRTFFQRHPKVKAAAIGAGVGAGVGAITGLITHHGVVRGALIGGGAGAGVGLVRSSSTLKRHPIVRNIATGSLVGLGIGAAASHGHRRLLQGAGIGAAIGLGASLLNGEFK